MSIQEGEKCNELFIVETTEVGSKALMSTMSGCQGDVDVWEGGAAKCILPYGKAPYGCPNNVPNPPAASSLFSTWSSPLPSSPAEGKGGKGYHLNHFRKRPVEQHLFRLDGSVVA